MLLLTRITNHLYTVVWPLIMVFMKLMYLLASKPSNLVYNHYIQGGLKSGTADLFCSITLVKEHHAILTILSLLQQ